MEKRTAVHTTPQTKLSDGKIATIIQYRNERMTWREISKKTGLTIGTLRAHRIVGNFGHGVNRSVRRFVPTGKQISDVQKYRAEGKSWIEISAVTDLNVKTLRAAKAEGFFGGEPPVQRSIRRKDLTEDQIREIKRLLSEKANWKEIVEKTGIPKQNLDRRRNECLFGIEHRVKSHRTSLSEEQISAARAGLAEGKPSKVVARSINVGRDAFLRHRWDGLFGDEYADAERARRRRLQKR